MSVRKSKLLIASLMAVAFAGQVQAYVVNITAANPRAVYLRVGDGSMSGGGTYNGGSTPQVNSTMNIVTVTVPANAVGNGTSQAMTTTARTTSDLDNFAFCNAGQVYIGGFYRRSGNTADNAVLTVTAPATLSNGVTGQTIPINQISWVSSGNDDTGAQPVPSGTFTGGSQTLANNFLRNTWRESCLSFRYANQNVVAAGTYRAVVTYTLTAP